ncbi:DUF1806 family protein, partial [Staphylococcus aureus]|uniref:DUF1806 family protein n=1 Tax=Staphylococcus aureus TaxID=1280 RepID=UPI003977DC9F
MVVGFIKDLTHFEINELSNGGWVYVQGLTHFEINEHDEFLIAGFNYEGQLAA